MNEAKDTAAMSRNSQWIFAFGVAIPIGLLGGLIGLGGAEFRLPVLAGPLRYSPRQAVPLNLAISMITVSVSLVFRSRTIHPERLVSWLVILSLLAAGALLGAYWGAGWAERVSNEQLKKVIFVLLSMIGLLLVVEGFLPLGASGLIPVQTGWQLVSGLFCGVAIGLFSSVLGVAGGELIIPTLIFVFGMEIKLAGSASLLISLPTMAVGIFRYARQRGVYRQQDLRQTILPMGGGSILGAAAGGMLVGFASTQLLKLILGLILCYSAWRIFK